LRPEDIESKILPLYEKHRVKHDVYTYQELAKLYLKLRDLDMVFSLWDRVRADKDGLGLNPSYHILNVVLEAGIRKKDSDRLVEVLEKYVELKKEPPKFLLQKISHTKDLPDRLFVLMKEHFPNQGQFLKKVRDFSLPTFREKNGSVVLPSDKNHKRIRVKKQRKATMPAKTRKELS
jgi:hypothetical protein